MVAHEVSDAALRLVLAPGLGPVTIRRLVRGLGGYEQAAAATLAELSAIDGIGAATAAAIRDAIDRAEPQPERDAMEDGGARLVLPDHDEYPPLLAAIPDPPAALWVRGALGVTDRLALAVVGSRRCTAYGREQAGRFASLLSECGLTIGSGGALGIDGEAHRGALRVGGRTITVMGCGLGTCYPAEHAELFERIVGEGGALVSEYPMATPPRPGNFPRRNRIISGLGLGVLVIEAARRSGALITARRAAEEHGREVMAVPGRIDSPASAGCAQAIREGWAALVTSHADVLAQLEASSHLVRGALAVAGHPDATSTARLFDGHLTTAQKAIVEVLDASGETILVDQIAARTRLPMSRVRADLTLLQIRGRIHQDSSGVRLKK